MRGPVFIVIPAYNEEAVIRGVVSELVALFEHVVVVDDGSSDRTGDEARAAGATVVRHIINRGQGAALQTGIEFALRRDAQVIVTFDADGQHAASDVAALVDALEKHAADISIGSRFLTDSSAVPFGRRMLLRLAVIFMRITARVPLTDVHNGLRAIRRQAAAKISITLDGMAHASEIIDEIQRNSLRVVEVPVHVRYTEYSLHKGQSGAAAFRIAFEYLFKRWFL